MPEYTRVLVWFRRDLRDYDHAALYRALKQAREVVCAFVFDREILDALPDPVDRRVEFIHAAVEAALLDRSVAVHQYKDAVIFECEEVLTAGKTPFSVFAFVLVEGAERLKVGLM